LTVQTIANSKGKTIRSSCTTLNIFQDVIEFNKKRIVTLNPNSCQRIHRPP